VRSALVQDQAGQHGIDCCEATAEAAQKWGEHVNAAAHVTLLPTATHSWSR
jgi:hypothetical protein